MSDLFQLSAPWWHFVLRAVAIYALVMVLMRASGKRAVGQFTPFDLVLLILIGNAVQNGINGGDNSLTGALIMATTLIALNYAVAFVTSRNRRAERLVEGVPVVLARDGHVFERVLREQLVSDADFHKALRQHDIASVSQVALALLETNGSISIVTREAGGSERAASYLAYFDGAKDQLSDDSSDNQSRGRR
ncbi:DUF421 domain-containing protein [Pseudoluteimonas lycopersici]|uniref:DUF421 domain-containing protein n=1 Tax=Pseudoluteimonas lycopersici TaxID=1324796 RepID=A0A516V6R7_9GAMM|nr:DUF421 domain-containing protein [Lysobacter lycopersici]